jgi:hypothetical protein
MGRRPAPRVPSEVAGYPPAPERIGHHPPGRRGRTMLHKTRLDLAELSVEAFEPGPAVGFHPAIEPDPNATMNLNPSDCCFSNTCLCGISRFC